MDEDLFDVDNEEFEYDYMDDIGADNQLNMNDGFAPAQFDEHMFDHPLYTLDAENGDPFDATAIEVRMCLLTTFAQMRVVSPSLN